MPPPGIGDVYGDVVDDDLEYVDDCDDNEGQAFFKTSFCLETINYGKWLELSRSYPLLPPPGEDVYGDGG